MSPVLCFHCGAAVPPGTDWSTTVFASIRPMCCPGCAAVAESIVGAGMENFYRDRDGYSAQPPELLRRPEELRLFDIRDETQLGRSYSYAIEGIRCAACIWLIERTVRALPGVTSADLNVATGMLYVENDPSRHKPSDVLMALQAIGYVARPADATPYSEHLLAEKRSMFRRLFIAGLSMMQVMMYAIPAYLAGDGTMEQGMADLMRWAGLLLTLPAILYSAQPFFLGAWRSLANRVLGMDVPVALGILAAFGASCISTLNHADPVYFDSITMFIFLLLASRHLELHARVRAASALDARLRAAPASAWRMPQWPQDRTSELVDADALSPGDIILLRTGDVLPADSVVVEGEASIDFAVLTGESRAQRRSIRDELPAGASNPGSPVVVRVLREAKRSTLALIVGTARKAQLAKPDLATWADAVAARFVALLLLLAMGAFLYWQSVDPVRAWPVLIAVLVASCPCALSLAAPTVLAAANARLLGAGILAVRPQVLETLHRATHVVFDKTGTLTEGKPCLHSIDAADGRDRQAMLALAGSIAAENSHPMSVALFEAAKHLSRHRLQSQQTFPGRGIEAEVDGTCYRLGNRDFVRQLANGDSPFTSRGDGTEIYLASGTDWLARFTLQDKLRRDARPVIDYFTAVGKKILILSGDSQPLTGSVARDLDIDQAVGDCLPQQKLAAVCALQGSGAVVAMIGDGINDAAVLGVADVSFAMGEGCNLAKASADCILLSGHLESLCEVNRVADASARLMKQNLAWAAAYNLCAIPTAALGMLSPWMSAVGMSLSSMLVVLNALRIYRRPPLTSKPVVKQWLSLAESGR